VDFNSELDESNDIIFYFRFSPDGVFESGSNKFTNLKEDYETSRYTLSLKKGDFDTIDTILTKNIADAYMYNSLEWDTIWDGIAC
jgi:hypothetical protein